MLLFATIEKHVDCLGGCNLVFIVVNAIVY